MAVILQRFQWKLTFFFVDYDEMVATMQRLQTNFKKHGMHALASRLNIAQNLLLKSVVAKALDTRVQLLQRRFPRVQNPISYNAQKLTKDVSRWDTWVYGVQGVHDRI